MTNSDPQDQCQHFLETSLVLLTHHHLSLFPWAVFTTLQSEPLMKIKFSYSPAPMSALDWFPFLFLQFFYLRRGFPCFLHLIVLFHISATTFFLHCRSQTLGWGFQSQGQKSFALVCEHTTGQLISTSSNISSLLHALLHLLNTQHAMFADQHKWV